MKKAYEKRQLFILINQLLVILFMCHEYVQHSMVGTEKLILLIVISLIIFDSAYICYVNLKGNITLSRFTNLLILVSWQFLLSFSESSIFYALSTPFSVFILYKAIQFLLFFFFQDTAYAYKKGIDWILKTICVLTLIAFPLNDRLFALFFLVQWILSFVALIFLFLKHRKRIIFILKSEKIHLLKTGAIISISFIVHVTLFGKNPDHLSNFGWYIMIIFPLFSIHSIAFKNKKAIGKYLSYKEGNLLILSFLSFVSILSLGLLFNFNVMNYFIIIHTIFLIVLLHFTFVYRDVSSDLLNPNIEKGKNIQGNFYTHNLMLVAKEEELKRTVSNYLHDEILQDILSIKNMMSKSNKEEIYEMIIKVLDNLNVSIRGKMQEYHPTILKTLTLKENYSKLLEMIQRSHRAEKVDVTFNCKEDLFLVEPYNLVFYRILKELVTNAFKHSKCTEITVNLIQENDTIKLTVVDDGVGLEGYKKQILDNHKDHKGLNSIHEQIFLLNGKIDISQCIPSGVCISIQMPMKGDDSYQYFINR